jgi:hypothetical protein
MDRDIVAERLEWLAGKGVIDAFRLLKTHDIGVPFGEPCHRSVKALLDGVHIPGGDSHGRWALFGLLRDGRRAILHLKASGFALSSV